MFLNYFADDVEASAFNLTAIRIILALYVLWKTVSLQTHTVASWPVLLNGDTVLLPPAWFITVERVAVIVFGSMLLFGYRKQISAFVTSLLFAHLGFLEALINSGGETQQMMIGALFVILFGLYASDDADSYGGVKWMLFILSAIYAGAGLYKMVNISIFGTAGFEVIVLDWIAPENMARFITIYQQRFPHEFVIGSGMKAVPLVTSALAAGTIMLEVSLVGFVLAGWRITPIMLGLAGMHVGIALGMGIFFFDMLVFLAVFFDYEYVYEEWLSTLVPDWL